MSLIGRRLACLVYRERYSMRQYFDTKEASRRYNLSESWLAKLRLKGGGPSHIKCGRRVLYEAESFEDWLEARRRTTTSEAR
jgi:Helix-turn-helix domain